MDASTVTLIIGVCFSLTGNTIANYPHIRTIEMHNTHPHENSEIVGNIGLGHLKSLKTRSKLKKIITHAKIHHLLHPHLLLSPTPQEFINDDIIHEPSSNLKNDHAHFDPFLGEINQFEGYEQPKMENLAYQDHQASFSIIPSNWKPLLNGDLYGHSEEAYPHDGAFLSILPGQWKENDGYETYYNNYDITPISYNIPDDYFLYNARDAQRTHSHSHHHGHQHSVVHHGKFKKSAFSVSPPTSIYLSNGHEDFSSHSKNQHSYFPSSIQSPNNQMPTDKHNTIFVLPPSGGNFQISQVSGNNNAVSQSQSRRGTFSQSAYVVKNQDIFDHSQNDGSAPFISKRVDPIVGAPKLIDVGNNRKIWKIAGPDEADIKVVIKRSTDKSKTINKRKKRQLYYNNFYPYQNAQQIHCSKAGYDPIVGAPNVFSTGSNRRIWSIPGPDEADISVVIKRSPPDSNNKRKKRSFSPLGFLDVTKTFENIESVAKHSLDSTQAPLHHVADAMSAAQDALISTLSIPQDLFIPSRYAIVKKEALNNAALNDASEKAEEGDIYNRMGNIFRKSFRSGQDALTHTTEFFNNAKKALSSSKNVASRLRTPGFKHRPLFPQLLNVNNDLVGAEHYSGRGTDADGDSVSNVLQELNPKPKLDKNKVGVKNDPEVTIKDQSIQPQEILVLQSDEDIYKTLNVLDNAKKVVGAKSLKELFKQIKEDLNQRKKLGLKVLTNKRISYNKHMNGNDGVRFLHTSGARNAISNSTKTHIPVNKREENTFLVDLFNVPEMDYNTITDQTFGDEVNIKRKKRKTNEEILEAINPEMFKNLFNMSLESAQRYNYRDPSPSYDTRNGNIDNQNQLVGLGMEMGDALLTPFLGKLERQETYPYPYDYSDEDEYYDEY